MLIPKMSGPVAQVVEQLTFNQWVGGSNPPGLTIFHTRFYHWEEITYVIKLKYGQHYAC